MNDVKPTSSTMKKIIKQRKLKSEGLVFPHMTSRLSGSDSPTKTEWLPQYLGVRKAISENIVNESALLDLPNSSVGTDRLNRIRGSLIGAAVGDALGTTLEFKARGSFAPINDIVGGGPFNLKAGEWTDDTSMMYCLAHSLVRSKSCDLRDQMELYCRWWKDGVFSVNGVCFDVGNTVQVALERYLRTGEPKSGSTDPMSAGNGSLMRLAPIPIRYYDNFEYAVKQAARSSITTHGATEAVDACRYFSSLIWGALHGVSKNELLNGLYSPIVGFWDENPLCDSIAKLVANAEYKVKDASKIRASGYVMHTLEAVLWAFYRSKNFESGALESVNLGEDADTTGAIYGQLAGAYFGEKAIPINWIEKIKENHIFYLKAQELDELIGGS